MEAEHRITELAEGSSLSMGNESDLGLV